MAPMPRSFARWVATAAAGELAGQPAVDRLATLHEQMHRLARLVLLKSRDGEPPSEARAWLRYRQAMVWGLVIGWLITPPQNYGVEITRANIAKMVCAMEDLDTLAAIP